MTLEIRLLGLEDVRLLHNIAPGVFDDPPEPAATRAFLADDRHHLIVALDAGRVVGFISAVHYLHPDKTNPEMWINEVGVAPSHHKRGIGKSMLEVLRKHARSLGCKEAWVLTNRSNRPAMKLYKSAGGTQDASDEVMFSFDLTDDQEP